MGEPKDRVLQLIKTMTPISLGFKSLKKASMCSKENLEGYAIMANTADRLYSLEAAAIFGKRTGSSFGEGDFLAV